MTNIRINDNQHTTVTRQSDPNDQWDNDDTATDHNIESFYVVDDNDYGEITVMFDIDDSRDYYLLYTIYSTGDSFSHHEGEIAFIDLFESKEMAEENRRRIVEHNDNESDYHVLLQLEDGRVYKSWVQWKGYFEHLTEVNIERIKVSKKDKWVI